MARGSRCAPGGQAAEEAAADAAELLNTGALGARLTIGDLYTEPRIDDLTFH